LPERAGRARHRPRSRTVAHLRGRIRIADSGDIEKREFKGGDGDEYWLYRRSTGDSGRASTIPVLAATIAVVA
jgi:hypothetical protein